MSVSTGLRWKVPASVLADTATYSIHIYVSTAGENGTYNLLSSISAGGGNATSTYTDSGGDPSFFYLVRYVPSGGSEGGNVLAVQTPGITEQRLAEQIQGKLPEIIAARIDSNLIDIRKAMQNALDIINAYSPQTSYTYTNLPGRFETAIIIFGMTLLYMEHQLQVAIRDYSYSGTGINFTVDRNSKFASTLQTLMKAMNDMLGFLKQADWPMPIGHGSEAFGAPFSRIMGNLYGTGSINP